ncbi:M36 family metallopeptidase, partial [Rubrivirga sp.]|uniref:M36 family metallopeptidase n=1 Tax=Rubrivirga sp. TaxID=1885344 RepID=UPI003C73B4C9
AVTGAILEDVDLVERDAWAHELTEHRSAAPLLIDALPPAAASSRTSAATSSYRVVPAPFESPSRSPFVLVTDPADPVASPLGWHSTGTTDYTTTRGNNVYAYTDTDDNNVPDSNSAPDGGAELVFDFEFGLGRTPAQNAPASVTNLFYWNNVVHDVLYRYGFDEAAGNFQDANFVIEGGDGDEVRAEALDGSGTNNANFGTPSEGSSPRMQMFRWTGAVDLEVTAPTALAGALPSLPAGFGPGGPFAGRAVEAGGGSGPNTACTSAEVNGIVAGRVALVERGGCNFDDKIANVGRSGAIGAIVYNRLPEGGEDDNGGDVLVSMGGDGDPRVDIPSVFIRRSAGLALISSADPVEVSVTQEADRASSFDAGIVTHEYGHGISNRLIGGPNRVSCLRNGRTDGDNDNNNRPGEQMGEGWSDYYGLMLTQREGDLATQPRGVGSFVQFEIPDGPGIRPAPYSTDFAINDYTYQDVVDNAGHTRSGSRFLSIPHGVGFAWATVLWEMTWDLIETQGFDADIANADGMAGNQIALNLVTTGLKLTACTPGFVDGRDAILAADAALYPHPEVDGVGVHHDLIWAAFARRGLGVLADQGSASANNDGRSDFSTPPLVDPPEPVASDDGPASRFEVSTAAPNPASRTTRVIVTVDRAQPIDVVLYDALGRQVRQQTEAVAAGTDRSFQVDLGGLPAGVYALRVTGETASETRSLTVVR